MSESAIWLRTLQVGDVITIKWRNELENVVVVKGYNPRREKTVVWVKRKHLKQLVYLADAGEWVSCRFSNHQGNEHLDFRDWRVIPNQPHTLGEGQGI